MTRVGLLLPWALVGALTVLPELSEAQNRGVPDAVAPAREGLADVPLPPLEGLDMAVAEQIRAARRDVEQASGARQDRRDLAAAYGSLAQVLHVYEFSESAAAAYGNAARLAPGELRWRHLLGYLFVHAGRLEEAADSFAAVLQIDRNHREATLRLGDVYLQLNRLREAREQFDAVVDVFPAVARQGLGEIALREGRFEEAVGHFRAVLARVPAATTIHYSLAMAYRGLGRLDDARAHLRQQGPGRVSAADPMVDSLQSLLRGERALVIQGRRAYEVGQFQAAAAAFANAASANPQSAPARANLGLALSQLGNAAGAQEQFEAALRLDPGSAVAHAGLGMLLAQQRRDAEAVEHLRAVLDQTPEDPTLQAALIGALLRLGRDAAAIEVLERSRSLNPEDEGTVVGLAILLADRLRYGEAVALLDESNRRFPERTATATTLARLLASSPDRSLRDGSRALELAEAVYAVDPTAVHAETIALALAELGRCADAAEWIRRAAAAAVKTKDDGEAARLRGELSKYDAAACRAPGT